MSTPDLSSPAAVAAFLRQYNTWRRDESELDAPDRPKMPAPADLGRVIDAAVRMLESRPTPHGRSDDLLIQNLRARTWPGDCEAAASAEREACAKLCDDMTTGDRVSFDWERGTSDCAHAIRARNQPTKGED